MHLTHSSSSRPTAVCSTVRCLRIARATATVRSVSSVVSPTRHSRFALPTYRGITLPGRPSNPRTPSGYHRRTASRDSVSVCLPMASPMATPLRQPRILEWRMPSRLRHPESSIRRSGNRSAWRPNRPARSEHDLDAPRQRCRGRRRTRRKRGEYPSCRLTTANTGRTMNAVSSFRRQPVDAERRARRRVCRTARAVTD